MAIDVNTGRYVGKHNLEETILKTNLEAVKEIAYQIQFKRYWWNYHHRFYRYGKKVQPGEGVSTL